VDGDDRPIDRGPPGTVGGGIGRDGQRIEEGVGRRGDDDREIGRIGDIADDDRTSGGRNDAEDQGCRHGSAMAHS
jgi:hypothetical protein